MQRKGNISDHIKKLSKSDRNKVALVGIIEPATYPDGELVAQVGYWNEYGVNALIPARKQVIYKSINQRTGEFNRGGRFVKASKSNFSQVVDVPAHRLVIPPRPFFRTALDDSRDKSRETLSKAIIAGMGAEKSLLLAAEVVRLEIRNNILTWSAPANAPSTVRSKGYNAPLRGNDRLLRNSITTAIEGD